MVNACSIMSRWVTLVWYSSACMLAVKCGLRATIKILLMLDLDSIFLTSSSLLKYLKIKIYTTQTRREFMDQRATSLATRRATTRTHKSAMRCQMATATLKAGTHLWMPTVNIRWSTMRRIQSMVSRFTRTNLRPTTTASATIIPNDRPDSN